MFNVLLKAAFNFSFSELLSIENVAGSHLDFSNAVFNMYVKCRWVFFQTSIH